jgi:putative nucleotide binding protein
LEDYAHILDYLPQGRHEGGRYTKEPVAYALGEDEFKLFELIPKEKASLVIGDRVYVGKEVDLRAEILHVKRRISYDELTNAAQNELMFVVDKIVKEKEEKFVTFFNHAQAITTRFHMLELLPGLGKKSMWAIIQERRRGDFVSFNDITKRVGSIHHPAKLVAKRIHLEISDPDQKYHIFVAK